MSKVSPICGAMYIYYEVLYKLTLAIKFDNLPITQSLLYHVVYLLLRYASTLFFNLSPPRQKEEEKNHHLPPHP